VRNKWDDVVTAVDPLEGDRGDRAPARAVAARGCRARGGGVHLPGAPVDAARREQADSICFNPHKWLLTNFDCDLLWTSDKAA